MTCRQYLKVPDEVSWHMQGKMGPGKPERFNSLDSPSNLHDSFFPLVPWHQLFQGHGFTMRLFSVGARECGPLGPRPLLISFALRALIMKNLVSPSFLGCLAVFLSL